MTLHEHDIFNYVFFNKTVNSQQQKFIKSNNAIAPLVKLYKRLKIDLEKNVSLANKIKLSNAITDYKLDSITLKPHHKTNDIHAQPSVFIDDEKALLIETNNNGQTTFLTIISNENVKLSSFTVKIFPQNKLFKVELYDKPIEIGNIYNIEEICIEFNPAERDRS